MSNFTNVQNMYKKFGIGNDGVYCNALARKEYIFRIGAMFEEIMEYTCEVFNMENSGLSPDSFRDEIVQLLNLMPMRDDVKSEKRLEGQLDALVDLLVFTHGTAARQNFDFDRAFMRVMEKNREKELASSASESKRDFEIDLVKPERWTPPDLSSIVEQPKGILVLEGPDGTGKTTLAKKLAEKYDVEYIHCTWSEEIDQDIPGYFTSVIDKAEKLSKDKLVIIDRLWLSEHVYAKTFRDANKWKSFIVGNECMLRLDKLGAIYQMCLPFDKERYLEKFETLKQDREEMYDSMSEVYDYFERIFFMDKLEFPGSNNHCRKVGTFMRSHDMFEERGLDIAINQIEQQLRAAQ